MQLLTPGALDWIHQVWNLGFYSRSLLSSPAGLFHIICHLFCKNPRRRAVPSCALVSLWRLLFDICIVLERSWKYTLCLKKVKRPPGFTAEGAVVVVVCLFSVSRLFFVLFCFFHAQTCTDTVTAHSKLKTMISLLLTKFSKCFFPHNKWFSTQLLHWRSFYLDIKTDQKKT